jgi:tRNA-intron endonuclease
MSGPGQAPRAPTALANGRLAGDHVLIDDAAAAQRLSSRCTVGVPDAAAPLRLTLVEAAWAVADGKLAVHDGKRMLALADLLASGPAPGPRTEVGYLVYRDLRERGLVARPVGPSRYAVWPRGTDQGDPAFHVQACSDADGLAVADLGQAALENRVLAVADADGAITHYRAALDAPTGAVPDGDLPRAKGAVLGDRVLVSDAGAAEAYNKREFLGTRQGPELFLSFVEAEALRRRGILAIKPGLADSGDAALLLPIHLALRAAGAVPKSGFKFGTHMRAYRGDPEDGHAEWLVHCAAARETLPWSALSRGVRLAHGVRKKFLVAIPADGGPLFASLAWHRP